MSIIVSEICNGTATLESRAPAVGPAPVKVVGSTFTCASGIAYAADPAIATQYLYDVDAGTTACIGVLEWRALMAGTGESYAALFMRQQNDSSAYALSLSMNGNVILYFRNSGGSFTALNTWSGPPNLGNATWYRCTWSINSGFLHTITLINANTREELDSGAAVCLSGVTYTDTGSNLPSAGAVLVEFKQSGFGSLTYTDSAAAGPVITGPSGAAGAGTSTANVAENATTGPAFSTDIALTGGYPTLTGADAALFTIANPSGNNFRVDPVTAFDFESLPHANPFVVTFNASASVSQTCTITVTNVSEPPGPPTGVTATAGNTNASVAFTAPVNTGKPAITGYTVTSSPGGLTGTGSASPITVSGLTNGTAYTFTVTATNSEGTGTASSASNSVTPSGPVDSTPPTLTGSITVSSLLDTSYTLTWPAASDNVAVTGYEYSLNGGSTYTSVGVALTVSITGRTAGTTDQVRVRAFDSAGNRSSALAASVTLPSSVVRTPPLENNEGTLHLGATVHYSWYPAGRIGSFGAITPQEGTGVTNAIDGTLTIGTLSAGTGVLMTCVRGADASTDSIHYHYITVT